MQTPENTGTTEKSSKKIIFIILGILIAYLIIGTYSFYGKIVTLDEELKSYDAQIGNMYERRAELIPMIAQVVDAAAKYEWGTLTNITAYRSMANWLKDLQTLQWEGKTGSQEFSQAMNTTLLNMRTMQEAYPSLQAVKGFQDMTTTIEWSENRLRVAIKDYNDKVAGYNISLRSFPFGIIGKSVLGFKERERTFAEVAKSKTVDEKHQLSSEAENKSKIIFYEIYLSIYMLDISFFRTIT